jgi:peptidoglycan/LPS O-acetylase OafA/YrhL
MSADEPAGRLPGIEILRAAAVGMVLFQHLSFLLPETFPWWQPGGWLARINLSAGVDIFFCLSGFVVARALLASLRGLGWRAAARRVLGFWARRAFRLWPSAWLWLFAAYLVSVGFNRLGLMDAEANWRLIVPGILMFVNFADLYNLQHHQALGTMALYWTLSQEEQFYAALPLVLAFGARATLLCLAGFMAWWLTAGIGFWVWIEFRPGGLVAGVFLAFAEGGAAWRWLQSRTLPAAWVVRPLACAALCLLAAYLSSLTIWDSLLGVKLFRLQPALQALVCAALVTGAAMYRPHGGPGVAGRWLAAMGGRSYILYVVHPVAFAVAQEILFRLTPVMLPERQRVPILLVLGLSLLLAGTEATARLVEQPLRVFGRRLGDRVAGPQPGMARMG